MKLLLLKCRKGKELQTNSFSFMLLFDARLKCWTVTLLISHDLRCLAAAESAHRALSQTDAHISHRPNLTQKSRRGGKPRYSNYQSHAVGPSSYFIPLYIHFSRHHCQKRDGCQTGGLICSKSLSVLAYLSSKCEYLRLLPCI